MEHLRVRGTLARSANPFEMTREKKKKRRKKGKKRKGKKDCSIRWLRKETNLLTSLLRHTPSFERRTNRLPRFDTGLGKLCRSFLKQTLSLSLSFDSDPYESKVSGGGMETIRDSTKSLLSFPLSLVDIRSRVTFC